MSELFRKLNLKNQPAIVVLNSPESFEHELSKLQSIEVGRTEERLVDFEFLLAFVTEKQEIDHFAQCLEPAPTKDPIIWFAYPKGSSKRLKCNFNRDNGWDALKSKGYDTVRQVSIDDDWSALRFRNQHFISYKS